MIPEVVTRDTPARIVAYGRTNSPWYYWVAYTHMSTNDILAYRVEQARKDGLWGSATLKKVLRDVLDEGDEPTVALLEDGLTMGQAMERAGDWIERLRLDGHPLLNRWYGYRVPEPVAPPEPSRTLYEKILDVLRDHAWHTTAEIADDLVTSQDILYRPLERLCCDGGVRKEKCDGQNGTRGIYRYKLEEPLDISGLNIK
jgi:hypothetical protein